MRQDSISLCNQHAGRDTASFAKVWPNPPQKTDATHQEKMNTKTLDLESEYTLTDAQIERFRRDGYDLEPELEPLRGVAGEQRQEGLLGPEVAVDAEPGLDADVAAVDVGVAGARVGGGEEGVARAGGVVATDLGDHGAGLLGRGVGDEGTGAAGARRLAHIASESTVRSISGKSALVSHDGARPGGACRRFPRDQSGVAPRLARKADR